jgi:hypothetical protein
LEEYIKDKLVLLFNEGMLQVSSPQFPRRLGLLMITIYTIMLIFSGVFHMLSVLGWGWTKRDGVSKEHSDH